MKAIKKFERGGYKFTATLSRDYSCQVVSDDISIEEGGFIANFSYIYIEKQLFNYIDTWIMEREGKSKEEIDFALIARAHGFEIVENKKHDLICQCPIKHRDLTELQSGKCMDCGGVFKI